MANTPNLHIADCIETLRTLDAESVDACVTDPPYHLTSIVKRFGSDNAAPVKDGVYSRASKGFMGYTWDGGDIAHDPDMWGEVLRVLKPGAYLVSFSATRTYHRMACAIEAAGFDVRDMINYLYGSGFPKSKNDGHGRGTALKPSHEPMVLAQKPRQGAYAENDAAHGTGYLNIDAARVPLNGEKPPVSAAKVRADAGIFSKSNWQDRGERPGHENGRWPANVCHDGSDVVLAELPETSAERTRVKINNKPQEKDSLGWAHPGMTSMVWGGCGNAARFFYCAKPSMREKEAGLDGFSTDLKPKIKEKVERNLIVNPATMGYTCGGTTPRRNTHATIKPIELMRWLIRLVVPHGGVVLDPFLGSGTTAIAAVLENRPWIGIEREAEYAAIAQARVDWWAAQHKSRGGRSVAEILGDVPKSVQSPNNMDLFANASQ